MIESRDTGQQTDIQSNLMPEKIILVSGSFNSIRQPDKLRFFEAIDTALRDQGYRIVLLNQNPGNRNNRDQGITSLMAALILSLSGRAYCSIGGL